MRLVEEHALRVIGRMVGRGGGAIVLEVAVALGLSPTGARVVVSRLDRAGYLRIGAFTARYSDPLLIFGVTAAGELALARAGSRQMRFASW